MSALLLAIGGGVIAAILAFMRGRVSGAAKEREKQASERLKAREMGDQIDNAIAGRDPDEIREELKKWWR